MSAKFLRQTRERGKFAALRFAAIYVHEVFELAAIYVHELVDLFLLCPDMLLVLLLDMLLDLLLDLLLETYQFAHYYGKPIKAQHY